MNELLCYCRDALLAYNLFVGDEKEDSFGVCDEANTCFWTWVVELRYVGGRGEEDEEHLTNFLSRRPSEVTTPREALLAMLSRLALRYASTIDRVAWSGSSATFRWKWGYWELRVR